MLSCKQATDNLNAHIDGELSVFDRLAVRFHQFICEDCKHAAANMQALVSSMKDRPPASLAPSDSSKSSSGNATDGVDEEYVDRIMAALNSERDQQQKHEEQAQ